MLLTGVFRRRSTPMPVIIADLLIQHRGGQAEARGNVGAHQVPAGLGELLEDRIA